MHQPSQQPLAPAFRDVYDEHFGFVWRSLMRMGVREADLPDAAQEVFLARDRRRRAHSRYELLVERQPVRMDESSPEGRAAALQLLERALEGISLDQRAVFILFELEQSTGEEIAETLEISLGTVYSRLRRARELFRQATETANQLLPAAQACAPTGDLAR